MDRSEYRIRNFLFENNQIKIKTIFASSAKKQVKLSKLRTEGLSEGSYSDAHLHAKSHKTAPIFNNRSALRNSLEKNEVGFKCKEGWMGQRKLKRDKNTNKLRVYCLSLLAFIKASFSSWLSAVYPF